MWCLEVGAGSANAEMDEVIKGALDTRVHETTSLVFWAGHEEGNIPWETGYMTENSFVLKWSINS